MHTLGLKSILHEYDCQNLGKTANVVCYWVSVIIMKVTILVAYLRLRVVLQIMAKCASNLPNIASDASHYDSPNDPPIPENILSTTPTLSSNICFFALYLIYHFLSFKP